MVRFGKIGAEGRTTVHKYNSLDEGKKIMNNLIEKKIQKGYVEKIKKKSTSNKTKKANSNKPKECPPGKELNPATGRCVKIKTKKVEKPKECPPGKELNPATGRCVKIKTKKVEKPKECPPGKELNPATGRCVNIKTKKVEKPKECPPGKELNPATGRCVKIKTKKLTKKYTPNTKAKVKPPYNKDFLSLLNQLEKIMAMKGDNMRARAYQKAQQAIILYQEPINNVEQISQLKGIGKTILEKFQEYIETGKIEAIEKEKSNPLVIFTNIYGVGPKKAQDLVKKGITTIAQLRDHQDHLSSSQKLGLKYYDDINQRIPREEIKKYETKLNKLVDELKISGATINIVGSYRRGEKNSGDIDVIVTAKEDNTSLFSKFIQKLVDSNIIIHKLTDGKTKTLAISKLSDKSLARRLDVLYTSPKEYSFALLYFTGSKVFNTIMRQRALDRGFTLNEHGIYKMVNGKKGARIEQDFPDEKSIFDFLNMEYKRPEDRHDAKNVIDKSDNKSATKSDNKSATKSDNKSNKVGNVLWDVKKQGVMLAHTYKDPKTGKIKSPPKGTPPPPDGWWLSEKYDGYRAIWDGQEFRSRTGNIFQTPDWFKEWLPKDQALDGELFLGRDKFEACGIFRRKTADTEEWKKLDVTYQIFDSPTIKGDFEERQSKIKKLIERMCQSKKGKCPLELTDQKKVKNEEEVYKIFEKLVKKDAEGVMLRAPHSPYDPKRSAYLLKVKQFFDDECKIVGYKEGTGKYKEMLGAFECQLVKDKNVKFFISGMDDEIRKNYKKTHPLGTIVTFTYISKTAKGQPRHPNYLRKRNSPD